VRQHRCVLSQSAARSVKEARDRAPASA
jgi:hypothetical protein